MAIGIGGVFDIDQIGRKQFTDAAADAGLGRLMAMKRFDELAARFENALNTSARELYDQGFRNSIQISETILQTGGFRNL